MVHVRNVLLTKQNDETPQHPFLGCCGVLFIPLFYFSEVFVLA